MRHSTTYSTPSPNGPTFRCHTKQPNRACSWLRPTERQETLPQLPWRTKQRPLPSLVWGPPAHSEAPMSSSDQPSRRIATLCTRSAAGRSESRAHTRLPSGTSTSRTHLPTSCSRPRGSVRFYPRVSAWLVRNLIQVLAVSEVPWNRRAAVQVAHRTNRKKRGTHGRHSRTHPSRPPPQQRGGLPAHGGDAAR